MKKLFSALCTLFFFSAAFCQNEKEPGGKERAVASRVDLLRQQMIHPDSTVIDGLFSTDLSYGHSAGLVNDKATIIQTYLHGSFHFLTITLSDQTVHVAGDNAIVRHVLVSDFRDGEKSGQVKFGILMVWHHEKHQWKLLARQAVKL